MNIYTTNDESNRLAVWLTGEERANQVIMSIIEPIMSAFCGIGYKPVLYCSGTGDLPQDTAALLSAANQAEIRNEL